MAQTSLNSTDISFEDLERCTQIFEAVIQDSLILAKLTNEQRNRLFFAIGQVIRPDRLEVKRRVNVMRRARAEAKRVANRELRATATMRAVRMDSVFVAPPRMLNPEKIESVRTLDIPEACYICKEKFTEVHHFYATLCPNCASFNYEKRFQSTSLEGRVALITGARLKIGYHAALGMLRAGAKVIVTTRFPKDAAIRYAKENDFSEWNDRLEIYGLDLRHSPSVEVFTNYIDQRYARLDILINNAAQTVRRPPAFYAHMLEVENKASMDLHPSVQKLLDGHERCKTALAHPEKSTAEATWLAEWHQEKCPTAVGLLSSAELSQIPYVCDDAATLAPDLFPKGKVDADLQQVDLRRLNSWRMKLAEVPTAELLEVQLVNSIAPFILCSKLKPLMLRGPPVAKHIVNVSAMEGKFNRHTKTDKHPHTNMAKAALNMMTLTSARDYVKDQIYMNAVDTGWVTDEDPADLAVRKQIDHDFQPPLDIVDGAARVLDPIFSGIATGTHSWGKFLKDYLPTEW